MNADPRSPFGAPGSSPALASRRTRASTQTRSRENSTTLVSTTFPRQRRSSLQVQVQPHESHSHRADSPSCLCAACHLRPAVFPRRQDGRIVLPVFWNSPSGSGREVSRAPQLPGEMEDHVPNVAETTRSDACKPFLLSYLVGVEIWTDALHNWGRSLGGSSIWNVRAERHTDRGEGSSRGVPRLSGSFPIPLLLQSVAELTGNQRSWSCTKRGITVPSTKSSEYFRFVQLNINCLSEVTEALMNRYC